MSSDRFFSVDSPKAIKAQALGWLNAINYMAPAASGGAGNLCPHASPGCLALCLGWYSGQAGMISNAELETGSNATRASRVRKARMFMHDRQAFMMNMRNAINACLRKARREGLKLCVRPNGATDISWESPFIRGDHRRECCGCVCGRISARISGSQGGEWGFVGLASPGRARWSDIAQGSEDQERSIWLCSEALMSHLADVRRGRASLSLTGLGLRPESGIRRLSALRPVDSPHSS
jgi:hypothetical protein